MVIYLALLPKSNSNNLLSCFSVNFKCSKKINGLVCFHFFGVLMLFSTCISLMQKEDPAITHQLMIGHLHLIPLLVAKTAEDAGRLLGCRLRHRTLLPPLDIRDYITVPRRSRSVHVAMGWDGVVLVHHSNHCSSAFYIFFSTGFQSNAQQPFSCPRTKRSEHV